MHAEGICHRDLYDENVVVDSEDRSLIIDFELAALDVDPSAPCYDVLGASSEVPKPQAHISEGQPAVHWNIGPSGGRALAELLGPIESPEQRMPTPESHRAPSRDPLDPA